jgi:hypothetical protein
VVAAMTIGTSATLRSALWHKFAGVESDDEVGSSRNNKYYTRLKRNPTLWAAYQVAQKEDRLQNSVRRRKLAWLRTAAKKKGLPFDLTLEDLVVPTVCPVLGITLSTKKGQTFDAPSVDRIVPALGYVKGNIVITSMLANRLKNNASIDQLVKITKFYTDLTGYYHTC